MGFNCEIGEALLLLFILSESPYDEFKSLFDVNVIASCNCIKHVVRLMREQSVKGGHIFVINR